MSLQEVAVFGGGILGQSIARILALGGASVRIWARTEEARDTLKSELPNAQVCARIQDASAGANLIMFAVPAPAIKDVAILYGEVARGDHIVLHACRGLAEKRRLPHQVIRQFSCVRKIGVIGGPLYIAELAAGHPLSVVVASRFQESIDAVRKISQETPIRVHGSQDVIGVELAGAISNVSALAVGMAEELSLGDTSRGILLTHGLSEAARFGAALGASPATFAGLAGVGDLIPRRVTSTDRHYAVGSALAKGKTLSEILQETKACVEGVTTAQEAASWSKQLRIELPLVNAVTRVLEGKQSAFDALQEVLRLDFDPGRWLTAS